MNEEIMNEETRMKTSKQRYEWFAPQTFPNSGNC